MLEALHAARSLEFRRVLRACAIASSHRRQAIVLQIPAEQDPDSFQRAFHRYCRERSGRPVRLLQLSNRAGSEWTVRLFANLGLGDRPGSGPDATLLDLSGGADRLFERIRAGLAADLAASDPSAGPGLLVVEGDVLDHPTLLALLSHLSPDSPSWRTLPSNRSRPEPFVIVAATAVRADETRALPDGLETLAIRPVEAQDLRSVPDAAVDAILGRLSSLAAGPSGAVARRDTGAGDAETLPERFARLLSAGLYHDAVASVAPPESGADPLVGIRALAAGGRPDDAIALAVREAGTLSSPRLVEAGLLAVTRADAASAETLCELSRAAPDGDACATALLEGEVAMLAGDLDTAERCAHAAASGDTAASAANLAGKVAFRRGQHDRALTFFRQAGERARPRSADAARSLHNLGLVALRRGAYVQAVADLQEAVVLSDASGEPFGGALARYNLAVALEHLGRYQPALEYAVEAADRLSRLGRTANLPGAILTIADLLVTFGEWDRALALVDRARDMARLAGQKQVLAFCRLKEGECGLLRGRPDDAVRALDPARLEFSALGLADDANFASARLAEACLAAGDLLRADSVATEVEDRAPPSSEATGRSLLVRGLVHLSGDAPARALGQLSKARDVLKATGPREALAAAYAALATAFERLGDTSAASGCAEESRSLVDEAVAAVPAEFRHSFLARPGIAALLRSPDVAADSEPEPIVAPDPSRVTSLGARPRLRHLLPNIVGDSEALRRVLTTIERLRDVQVPVLLLGESGTGKELFADALHRLSPRNDKPFIRVNAAAFSETLLLSELFGHEKGAFTGAHARKQGKFEAANGGTLFLDEIGDVSERLQVALLRVLEEQRFERVGGNETVRVNVRLVFATNRDLGQGMEDGRIRRDFYHRISGVAVRVPPLRERLEDVPALVEAFKAEVETETGRTLEVSRDAMALLASSRWPGNIRELKNTVRKACLLMDGSLLTRDVLAREAPELAAGGGFKVDGNTDVFDLVFGRGISLFDARKEVEAALIREALVRSGGNISAAAQILGMKRPRLSQLVKEYGLKVGPKKATGEAIG